MQGDAVSTNEILIERVYSGFNTKSKEEISIEDVRKALADVLLADAPKKPRPRLKIDRLSLKGIKTLKSTECETGEMAKIPVSYDQGFSSGVNVILIVDNDVGKSSILKTVKFMLTGDDDDYDADVARWLTQMRLQFSLGEEVYTITIRRSEESVSGFAILCAGRIENWDDDVNMDAAKVIFSVPNKDEMREALKTFFFDRLDLSRLSWTLQPLKGSEEPREAGTSWKTYFQALHIPDSSDHYLLCNDAHATGNQDGLILSTFLGLHLVDQLNSLGVESAKIGRVEKNTQTERAELNEKLLELTTNKNDLRDSYLRLNNSLFERRKQFVESNYQEKLNQVQKKIAGRIAVIGEIEREISSVSETLSFLRSQKAQIRELVDLKLHLTGLSVSLCPNCDSTVSKEEIQREENKHECRLCGKAANDASPEEIDARLAEEAELTELIESHLNRRNTLRQDHDAQIKAMNDARQEAFEIQTASQQRLEAALPTDEEESQRSRLSEGIGQNSANIQAIEEKLEAFESLGANDGARRKILEKARSVLQLEAERRNAGILKRLGELTEEMSNMIGAESITNVSCSALGKVKLLKHGERVLFTGIKNPGERLRVKLAFFLALMRIGREPGMGRHPSLLLIDQPGSAEIVPEDFIALASVLRAMDTSLDDQIQVLCFTARSEFSEATRPERIYGPQSGKYAF